MIILANYPYLPFTIGSLAIGEKFYITADGSGHAVLVFLNNIVLTETAILQRYSIVDGQITAANNKRQAIYNSYIPTGVLNTVLTSLNANQMRDIQRFELYLGTKIASSPFNKIESFPPASSAPIVYPYLLGQDSYWRYGINNLTNYNNFINL